jgi:hypothetical protein
LELYGVRSGVVRPLQREFKLSDLSQLKGVSKPQFPTLSMGKRRGRIDLFGLQIADLLQKNYSFGG